MKSSKLFTYITSTRVGYGYWRGTKEIFIINWHEWIRMYEALVEISDNFSGIQKHTRLENCVDPIPYLQSVQN